MPPFLSWCAFINILQGGKKGSQENQNQEINGLPRETQRRQNPLQVSPPAAAGYGSLYLNVALQWQTVRAAYGASGQKELSLADIRSQSC